MRTRIDKHDRDYGVIELDTIDGYHAGTVVSVFVADDGSPVVQIDTPQLTETHEVMRVYMNDSIATQWRHE